MLQTPQRVVRGVENNSAIETDNSAFSCTALRNQGSFSTVEIAVGTPEQIFHVVADTGSDSVIIQSCVCQEMNSCNAGDHCFTGTDHSSSFQINDGPQGPPGAIITFGSGPIHIAVATDLVRVGHMSKTMTDGVLLMVDKDLDFGGPFEGILGLGLPSTANPEVADANLDGLVEDVVAASSDVTYDAALVAGQVSQSAQAQKEAVRDASVQRHDDGLALVEVDDEAGLVSRHRASSRGSDMAKDEVYDEAGFLERAGVSRFSMCFNDDGSDGALRLNPPAAARTLGNVGHDHWAVDFRGVSIGESTVRVEFCSAADMPAGQETPCAGIPDSGTTAIMAPQAHLDLLFESLCDEWSRCSALAHTGSKAGSFQNLLTTCDDWMDEAGSDLSELPSIKFHVRGADGSEQELELPAWGYVVAMIQPDGKRQCEPAFSDMDYNTQKNGPVWILGTPFFYTHEIGYDLQSSPPGISFTSLFGPQDAPCGSCGSARLVSHGNALFSGSTAVDSSVEQRRRQPRHMSGPNRRPSIDTSKPL